MKEKNFKIANRIHFIIAENTEKLEDRTNRWLEERCANFANAPKVTFCPPVNDGVKVVLMVLIEYSIKVPVVEESTKAEEAK